MGLQDFWGPLLPGICSWRSRGCRIRSERGVRLVRRIVPSLSRVGIFAGPCWLRWAHCSCCWNWDNPCVFGESSCVRRVR